MANKKISDLDAAAPILTDSIETVVSAVSKRSTISQVIHQALYQEIWLPADRFATRVTNGATAGKVEYVSNYIVLNYYDFDKDTEQAIQTTITMPSRWDTSTGIKVRHKWTNGETGGTGGVVWGCRGQALSNSDPIDSAWGTEQIILEAFITDGDLHETTQTPSITIGGTPAAGDLIILEVFRKVAHASDDYNKKARYLGCWLQYQENVTQTALWNA